MALDFKKLSDPAYIAEQKAAREAEEAAREAVQNAQAAQLERCTENIETLSERERSFVRSCRTRMGMCLDLSEKQAKWLADIAKRFEEAPAEQVKPGRDNPARVEVIKAIKAALSDLDLHVQTGITQVVVTREYSETLKRDVTLVSHGVDMDTGKAVILPCEPVDRFPDLLFDENLGYYLKKGEPDQKAARPSRRP